MMLTRPKTPSPPRGGGGGGGPLSSRGGTLLIAALLSLLAGAALLVFLRQYRDDVTSSDSARVVVAVSLVPKGTTVDVILEKRMYRVAKIRAEDLRDAAVTDPADLKGLAATNDISPGHQLTLGDFSDAGDHVGTRLADYERAITVPVDRAHGLVGKIGAGDRVDVITTTGSGAGGVTIATRAARGALVLAVPDGDGSGDAGADEQVTIRVSDQQAATIAGAADGGKVWLVLRPAVGARDHGAGTVATGQRPNGQPLKAEINVNVAGT